MSNSVNWVFHPWSYMNITCFSVHLDCWEFAKKNLELVGCISYQSPLLGCESTYLQNASTALREPIALVHPRSRIHTVGGAEFSVWKASPFSHARSVCTVWNEKALCCSSDSFVSAKHSEWDGTLCRASIWKQWRAFCQWLPWSLTFL